MAQTQSPSSAPEQLLTVPMVAEHLAVSPRQVWRLIAKGHIRVVRMGALTRVRVCDLNHYVESLSSDPFASIPTPRPGSEPES